MHLAHTKSVRGNVGGKHHHRHRRLIIEVFCNCMQVTRQRPTGNKAFTRTGQLIDNAGEITLFCRLEPGQGAFNAKFFDFQRRGTFIQLRQTERLHGGDIAGQSHRLFPQPQAETVKPADVGSAIEIVSHPCRYADQARQSLPPRIGMSRLALPQNVGIDVIYRVAGMVDRLHCLGMFIIQCDAVTRCKGILRHFHLAAGCSLAQSA